jgi:phenylacetate-CoA ligase
MLRFCATRGFTPPPGPPLPFVYVFGRSQFTVSFFGANVYPENVTVGLEQPEISGWVTGKFVLQVVEDANRDPLLTVAVELAAGETPSPARARLAAESIRTHLRRLNSEFAHYVPEERQSPRITLHLAGDPEYFPRGVKHRYTSQKGRE